MKNVKIPYEVAVFVWFIAFCPLCYIVMTVPDYFGWKSTYRAIAGCVSVLLYNIVKDLLIAPLAKKQAESNENQRHYR